MPVTTTADGKRIYHVSKTGGVTGADRAGAKASDIIAAMTDPKEGSRQEPQVEKAAHLIKSMRIEGADNLTARDQAVYEYLLAQARADGIENGVHTLALGDVLAFLGIKDSDRLWQSLERIAGTLVSYDIRDGGRRRAKFSLLSIALDEAVMAGMSLVRYEVPALVRETILAERSFAMLEINAFPKFRSRYTARLYPRLALRAGYDEALRKPWVIEPLRLAKDLGFVGQEAEAMNYAIFRRDVLQPVLRDIADKVRRFEVRMDETRGTGRGRPVTCLTFRMSTARRTLREVKASRLTQVQIDLARADEKAQPDWMPSAGVLSRAVTLTGIDIVELSRRWKAMVASAQSDPAAEIEGFEGYMLARIVSGEGADAVFAMWCQGLAATRAVQAISTPPPLHPLPKPVAVTGPVEHTHPEEMKAAPAADEKAARVAGRLKGMIVQYGKDMLYMVEGKQPGGIGSFRMDDFMSHYLCDHELTNWDAFTSECMPENVQATGRLLARALRIAQGCEHSRRVFVLKRLGKACAEWNLEGLRKAAGSIIDYGYGPAGKPVRPPRPRDAPKTGTTQVTEHHIYTGYAGPGAETSLAWTGEEDSFDDIDQSLI